jgi:hypothetical protein
METIQPGSDRQPFEPEMVLIPAGEFLMGSDPQKDDFANKNEQPQHRLYLPDYYLAKTPVTIGQYAAFVRATDHESPEDWEETEDGKGRNPRMKRMITLLSMLSFRMPWLIAAGWLRSPASPTDCPAKPNGRRERAGLTAESGPGETRCQITPDATSAPWSGTSRPWMLSRPEPVRMGYSIWPATCGSGPVALREIIPIRWTKREGNSGRI